MAGRLAGWLATLLAALGAAVNARELAAAREIMCALHAGGGARAWEQLQVLQLCAETEAWQELAEEAGAAGGRSLAQRGAGVGAPAARSDLVRLGKL